MSMETERDFLHDISTPLMVAMVRMEQILELLREGRQLGSKELGDLYQALEKLQTVSASLHRRRRLL